VTSNPPPAVAGHLYSFEQSGSFYLINATTGQVFPVSDQGRESCCAGITTKNLLHQGYLDPTDEYREEDDSPPTGIGSVLLNVTHHCNLACSYCIMAMPELKHSYQEERMSLTTETGEACIDFLAEEGYQDQISLTFFGGEPLLKFDLIRHIVEYAESRHPGRFNYQMITNGCLMKPEMHTFFRDHNFSFLWSLDGEAEVHDRLRKFKTDDESVFASSFAALQELRNAWPECEIGVNVTYFKQTLELPATMRYFRDQGIDKIRMDRGLVPRESPYAVGLRDTEKVNRLLSEMADEFLSRLLQSDIYTLNPFVNYMRVISKRLPRFRSCNSGLDYVTISATGEIYSCYKLLGVSDCRLGDVRTGFTQELPRKAWDRLHVAKRPFCNSCWARFICAGGCAADNRHLNNSYFDPARENCSIFLHAIELSIHIYFSLLKSAPNVLKQLLNDEFIHATDHPLRRDDILLMDEDGRVENSNTGGVYQLNDTSLHILSRCDGQHSMSDIAHELSARYGLQTELAMFDVTEQLFQLAKAGLIQIPSEQTDTAG
jgi:uncharacterized protein